MNLDIFHTDAFSLATLTDAINNMPFIPGRASTVVDWSERGINTTTAGLEFYNGVIGLVNPLPRGGPGHTVPKNKRNIRNLSIPHYQIDDGIQAEEVQNIRQFGQEQTLQDVMQVVNDRMSEINMQYMDPTLEFQRLGALQGIILNGDGSTLYNLFTEFGVTAPTEINFDLTNATPASGVLRQKCAQVTRAIKSALPNLQIGQIRALVGDTFFDQLLAHPEVVKSYLNTDMAAFLRTGYIDLTAGALVSGTFEFGGIVWENYIGSIGATPLVDPTKAYFFPVGVPGMYRTVYAPADYMETVNTVGLPRYAKQIPTTNDKGVSLEVQSNALAYVTRPLALQRGRNA